MFSNEEAIAKFKEIIGQKEGWQYLKDSQFINHLSVFVSWALRASQYSSERALQEQFLSTALNHSSILAFAEDRGYIPRKASPSKGEITITNSGTAAVSIPAGQMFRSNYGIDYRMEIPDTVLPGATATAVVVQLLRESIVHEVLEAKPYYEILFDIALTGKISRIDVSVDLHEGAGYQEWHLARLLQNTMPDSTVYDEFYTHTGLLGIRFGNGDFGKIVPLGASVLCVLWLTDGATNLQTGMTLTPTGDSLLSSGGGQISITFTVSSPITGGEQFETGDELRKNLFYWPLYQEQLVWKEDYEFFLKHKFPEILWINVWGETEAEHAAGRKRLEFINTIFISAYAVNDEPVVSDIMDALSSVNLLNRKFEFVAPAVISFTVHITGKVSSKYDPLIVKASIIAMLEINYGINSRSRKPDVLLKDVYALVEATGCFNDCDYYVFLAGDHETSNLNEIIAINLESSTILLTR
jgi:hypothetical protein